MTEEPTDRKAAAKGVILVELQTSSSLGIATAIGMLSERFKVGVLDTGGNLGQMFFTLNPMFPCVEIKWEIIEAENFPNSAQDQFSLPAEIMNAASIAEAGHSIGLVHVTGSLQYCAD